MSSIPKTHHKDLCRYIIGVFLFFTWILFAPVESRAEISEDKNTAVIFVYQRVGNDSVPQGNISLEQFKEHIDQLTKDGFMILPLEKIIDALKNDKILPPKTVAITFEGAYQTTLANVRPLLEKAHIPFTVFFASDMAEGDNPSHLTWAQIADLKKSPLVSLGILPSSYQHMTDRNDTENAAIINKAISSYREKFGSDPLFFAYPYGEFNNAVKKQLESYNFQAVFSQKSGVVHTHSDFMALPRFTMTDEYGDLDRFMLTANALPLPMTGVVPADTIITQNPPLIGFTVTPEIGSLAKLSCFVSSLGKTALARMGSNRIEIRLTQPLIDRRTRVNCTLPTDNLKAGEPQRWRWFSLLLIAPAIEDDNNDGEDDADSASPSGLEDTEAQ
jgi:peptidoglycan/xylan/chitin deacetylase (PgdA/CDA1 family)